MVQGIGSIGAGPLEDNAVKVVIQDQTTPPFLGYLIKSLGTFTLAAPTVKSTLTELYYTADLVAGHGLSADDQVLFVDTASDCSMFATVISVDTNIITIDKPWDCDFPVTSVCQKVTNKMNVDGSVAEQIFSITAGGTPADVYGITISMVGAVADGAPDDGNFGNIAGLTRGVVLRVYDGYDKVIGNAKNNGDIRSFSTCESPYTDAGPGGDYGINFHMKIKENWGVPFRLEPGGYFQAIVQDDLTDLVDAKISVWGQYTRGEGTV